MYIELIDGRFAGMARDIEAGAAHELIKQGRAKKAFQETAPSIQAALEPVAVTELDEPRVEKKKKVR